MAEKLNKIWAKAQPLSDYFDELQNEIAASPDLLNSISERNPDENQATGLTKTLADLSNAMAFQAIAQDKRSKAHVALRNSLIAGDLRLIGLLESSLEILAEEFWLTAEISPSTNSASKGQQKVSDLRVLTKSGTSAHEPAQKLETQVVVQAPDNPQPRPGGARSFIKEREDAIIESYTQNPSFDEWTINKRLMHVIDTAQQLFPDIDTSRGFGRSSVLETIKSLRETGRLPSNNVQ